MSVLGHLDPSPPGQGAYIHLMLDLYVREANKVESVMGSDERAVAAFEPSLMPAAQAELEASRKILRTIGATSELLRLDQELERQVGEDVVREFPTLRRLIAKALLGASPDGFGLNARAPEGVDVDLMVKEMVERGSDDLYLMQVNVPRAVAGAKRRAKDLRFTTSCQDEVGRLLSVLAAAVRSSGRILEIGTGAGVGLAWIVTGLRGRRDVEVISIEGDRRMAASASECEWPESVSLLTGDACEQLPELGTFDLVFADAAPVKYGDLGAMLGLLRPGGVLVVDDLCATPTSTDQDLAQRSALRAALLCHPDLQAVELDWSTRVIVATMACRFEAEPSISAASRAQTSAAVPA
jgi:predicted O-methyltransferase YrrM